MTALHLGIPFERLAGETVTGFRYACEVFLAGAAASADVAALHLLALDPAQATARKLAGRHGDGRLRVLGPDDFRIAPIDVIVELEHDLHRSLAVRGLLGRPRVPLALVTHGNLTGRRNFFAFYAPLILGGLQPWDRVVCASRAARDALIAHLDHAAAALGIMPSVAVVQIPWGVDTETFSPRPRAVARAALGWPDAGKVVLCHGRATLHNKQDLTPLLAVHRRLRARFTDVELVLSSTERNPYLTLLGAQARQRGLEGVRVVGGVAREQVPMLYAAADVAVALSDTVTENFGLTAVEAMACGVPVVAADWAGYRDAVVHGSTGFLVPTLWAEPEDELDVIDAIGAGFGPALASQSIAFDVDALEAALLRLLLDDELSRRLGDAGCVRARAHYDSSVVIARHVEMWREQLAIAGGTTPEKPSPMPPVPMRTAFAHYPTGRLSATDIIELSPDGRAACSGHIAIGVPVFRGQLITEAGLAALLEVLVDGRSRAVAEVEGRTRLAPASARRHTAWLIKQGLVRVVGMATSSDVD